MPVRWPTLDPVQAHGSEPGDQRSREVAHVPDPHQDRMAQGARGMPSLREVVQLRYGGVSDRRLGQPEGVGTEPKAQRRAASMTPEWTTRITLPDGEWCSRS